MDKTETFIKQCEKAEEIQALRKPYFNQDYPDLFIAGDVLFADGHIYIYANVSVTLTDWQDENGMTICIATQEEGRSHDIVKAVWLPRQDQLQEMYLNGLGPIHSTDLAAMFGCFADHLHKSEEFPKDYSMEQLWLIFVMQQLYDKVWNGEDWVPQ